MKFIKLKVIEQKLVAQKKNLHKSKRNGTVPKKGAVWMKTTPSNLTFMRVIIEFSIYRKAEFCTVPKKNEGQNQVLRNSIWIVRCFSS